MVSVVDYLADIAIGPEKLEAPLHLRHGRACPDHLRFVDGGGWPGMSRP
jgi:hypothetical protein